MHPGSKISAIYLCRDPVDFRKSISGLSAVVEQELGMELFGGALYLFTNRDRNRIKALYWDRNGFCLWYKRLEEDRFKWPKKTSVGVAHTMSPRELEWLLEGYDLWAQKPHKTLQYQTVT